jgi:hypothetical protein
MEIPLDIVPRRNLTKFSSPIRKNSMRKFSEIASQRVERFASGALKLRRSSWQNARNEEVKMRAKGNKNAPRDGSRGARLSAQSPGFQITA